ncbi:hypothetical protein TIFTF001_042361 [Ficus carica]|uniref:Uncharacterized protein n=1 Tax=Ficus carica TaxID=3494 RepID=A0AA87ZYX6_FICCA|nr:hypothetical protein TIFTF001_042356 [Ficus carica]GMN36076.1 hypothetical protein TIFTF001_042361 [Ficus carica]
MVAVVDRERRRRRRWTWVSSATQPTTSPIVPVSLPDRDGGDGFPARASDGWRWRSLATDLKIATWATVAGLVYGRWAARARAGSGQQNS